MRAPDQAPLPRGLDDIVEALTRFEQGDFTTPTPAEAPDALRPVFERLASLGRHLEQQRSAAAREPLGVDREKILHTILGEIPLLVAYVDRDLNYRYVNTAYERWFGVTRDECMRGNMESVLGAPVVNAVRAQLDAALRGEEQRFEGTVPYRRGGARHIKVHYIPDRAADGTVVGILGIVSDMTELKVRIDRKRAIVDTMQEGLFVQDDRGRITHSNPAAATLLGLDEAQLLGRTMHDLGWWLATEGEETRASPSADLALSAQKRSNVRMGMRTASGELRWLNVSVAPIATNSLATANGDRLVVTFSDVTALVQSEASFREVFDNSPIGIVKVDERLRFLSCNAAYARITGYSLEELLTMTALDLTHPDDLKQSLHFTQRGMETRPGHGNAFEKRYLHKDGHEIWVRITTHSVDSGVERQRYLLSLVEDITEHRRVQKELVDAKDKAVAAGTARTQFLANMSHEIRTPLNGILGNLEFLTSLAQADAPQAESLSDALFSGRSLLGILNDILDFSKIDAGFLQLDVAPFDVQHVIRSVEQTYGAAFRDKGVALELSHCALTPRWALGDSLRLRQILNNLVSNALKFTKEGVVRVRVTADADGALTFSVSDTGIGISAENLDRLFNPFTQAESSTTRRFGGTGLGLSISRQLARLMGGDITVSSIEGHGTTFSLQLRLAPCAEPQPHLLEATPVNAATSAPLRVLVAEDNVINQTIVKRLLEQGGHHVVLVGNGAEAIERLAAERFDVVLMDCQMPLMDGYEATRRIIEQHGAHRPTIIALTANAYREDHDRCLEAGMDAYLSKPFSKRALDDMLGRLTSSSTSPLRPAVRRAS